MCGDGFAGQRIRVRLSAIINFSISMLRNIFSIMFTLIVIRRLDPNDYGLYSVALNTSNALNTPYGIWSYWSSRRYVLGVSISPKGSLVLSLLYLLISIPVYISIVSPLSASRHDGFLLMLLIIMLYMLIAPSNAIYSLIGVYAPEKYGLLWLVFDVTRVTLAYITVIAMGSGIIGAVLGPGVANVVITVLGVMLLLRIGAIDISILNLGRDMRESLREAAIILRLSMLSIPSIVTAFLTSFDKYLMSLIASSTIPAAFISVSSVPKSIINPGSFTMGLYAKMLREPSRQDVIDLIILYSFASIFIASVLSLLAIPAITFFNPSYASGYILFILASVEALIIGYAAIFEAVATGSERADIASRDIDEIARTPLGKIPLIQMVRVVLSVSVAAAVQALIYLDGVRDPVLLALPYSIAYLVSAIPYTLYIYKLACKKIEIKIPWKDVLVFLVALLPSASIVKFLGIDSVIISSFWRDVAKTLPGVIASAIPYIVISVVLSRRLRGLVRSGLMFMRNSMKQSRPSG